MENTETRLRAELEAALALIEQQSEQLGQQAEQLGQQAEQLEQLQALVMTLERELGKNSSNSSRPPSSDSPTQRDKNRQKQRRKASGRKRGGQPGHKGHARDLVPIEAVDGVEHHFPCECENCWQPLQNIVCDDPMRHQVTELTGSGGVQVTEHQRHGVRCPGCGYVSWANDDDVPTSSFGPRLCSTIVLLTGVYHLSRRQAQRLLCEVFGIQIALGSISNIEDRISSLMEPAYSEAKAHADKAPVKHTDGTGWRQAGKAMQLWTVATSAVSVYTIVADGSADTLKSLFGRIKGILVSDRAKAINFWQMRQRQICWSHLARKFISFSERDGPVARIGTELVQYTTVLFQTHRAYAQGEISRRVFRQRMVPVRAQVEALLQRAVDADIKGLSGSCADILIHKHALWTFVDRRDVEPTNNHAERELRAFVLWRKRSFGTQSDRGNRFAQRIMTVVHCLRKQLQPVLPYLTTLATIGDPAASPSLLACA